MDLFFFGKYSNTPSADQSTSLSALTNNDLQIGVGTADNTGSKVNFAAANMKHVNGLVALELSTRIPKTRIFNANGSTVFRDVYDDDSKITLHSTFVCTNSPIPYQSGTRYFAINKPSTTAATYTCSGTVSSSLRYTSWSSVSGTFTTNKAVTISPTSSRGYIYYGRAYDYTGNVQTFTASEAGTYKLEVWGAQGGSELNENWSGVKGGLGGYAFGKQNLQTNKTLYVYIGKQGDTTLTRSGAKGGYNGGGNGGNTFREDRCGGAGGGGCTHIASSAHGELRYYNNSNFLNDVLLVAGGGGGAAVNGRGDGVGGGEKGGSATTHGTPSNYGKYYTSPITYPGGSAESYYQIGLGESAPDKTNGGDWGDEGAGGGGGGYYGGKACKLLGGAGSSCNGTGGSGYVNTSILTSASTIAGNTSFPSPSGGTETGHSGNGYAIITQVSY